MTRGRACAWAVAIAALAAPAPAAAAAPVSIPITEDAEAVTYAGGRAVWAESDFDGTVVVRSALSSGGRATALARMTGLEDFVEVSLAATGTGYLIALRNRDNAAERVVFGTFAAPPRTLVDCRPARKASADAPELTAVAGRDGFALAGSRCGTAAGVDLVGADGTLTPVPDVGFKLHDGIAYREPYLAVTTADSARVLDRANGTERVLPPRYAGNGSALALLDDGTLIFGPSFESTGIEEGIYAWPPGGPAPRLLASGAFIDHVFATAAGGVFFNDDYLLRRVGLAGGRATRVGAPGAGAADKPLALDGTHAAYASISCAGRAQLTVVDVSEPPRGVSGCPMRLAGGRVRFGPGGRAHVRLRCRNGCETELQFARVSTRAEPCDITPTTEHDVGPRCEVVASGKVRLHGSRRSQRVTVRLTAEGRRLRRTRPRLAVQARAFGPVSLDFEGSRLRTVLLTP